MKSNEKIIRQASLIIGYQLAFALVFIDNLLLRFILSFSIFIVFSLLMIMLGSQATSKQALSTVCLIGAFLCFPTINTMPTPEFITILLNVSFFVLLILSIYFDPDFYDISLMRFDILGLIFLLPIWAFIGYVTIGGLVRGGLAILFFVFGIFPFGFLTIIIMLCIVSIHYKHIEKKYRRY